MRCTAVFLMLAFVLLSGCDKAAEQKQDSNKSTVTASGEDVFSFVESVQGSSKVEKEKAEKFLEALLSGRVKRLSSRNPSAKGPIACYHTDCDNHSCAECDLQEETCWCSDCCIAVSKPEIPKSATPEFSDFKFERYSLQGPKLTTASTGQCVTWLPPSGVNIARVRNSCKTPMQFDVQWAAPGSSPRVTYRINGGNGGSEREVIMRGQTGAIVAEKEAGPGVGKDAQVFVEDWDPGNGQLVSIIKNPYPSSWVWVQWQGQCWGRVVIPAGRKVRVCVREAGTPSDIVIVHSEFEEQ